MPEAARFSLKIVAVLSFHVAVLFTMPCLDWRPAVCGVSLLLQTWYQRPS